MIPVKFLQKMGIHDLNFNGADVQAKVVDNEELVDSGIADLRSRLDSSLPIVGYDLKQSKGSPLIQCSRPGLLLLYVHNRCLLVQVGRMGTLPCSLSDFLSDESICFLALKGTEKKGLLQQRFPYQKLKSVVDIGIFAARALDNRALEGCVNLEELASEAGCHEQVQETRAFQCPESDPDWGALCFSKEEIKYAMLEAYMCYTIGTGLMSRLEAERSRVVISYY